MIKQFFSSFVLAYHNIRSQLFHTLLSVVGIVIGVASLVAILSLIDGMEKFANDQITNTTSLKAIVLRSEPVKKINDIALKKDSVTILSYQNFKKLKQSLTHKADAYFFNTQTKEIKFENDSLTVPAYITGVVSIEPDRSLIAGKQFTSLDLDSAKTDIMLTESLAKKLTSQSPESCLGRKVVIGNRVFVVTAIVGNGKGRSIELFVPITVFSKAELESNIPQCVIEAGNVEDVPLIKDQVVAFLQKEFPKGHDFTVFTNEKRVEQAARGFKLFRLIMGMIVGISVLVGGIGVMNVLLISVTERTSEIGIRKAVGANRRDIILQFLSESITVSMFGSLLGLILGVLGTMAFVPIIKSITGVPFQAAYTWNTFIVVGILAVVVGIVFGTYPAMRAAKLDPVDAIRHE
jgi:putative ABC transport system permease protein